MDSADDLTASTADDFVLPSSTNTISSQNIVNNIKTIEVNNTNPSSPLCVEGILHCRRGRSSLQCSSLLWKRRFVFLSLSDGGSITVYKQAPPPPPPLTVSSPQAGDKISSSSSSRRSASRKTRQSKKQPTTALRTVYSRLQNSISSSHRSLCPPYTTAAAASTEEGCDDDFSQQDDVMDTADVFLNDTIEFHLPAHIPWVVKDIENDTFTFVVEVDASQLSSSPEIIIEQGVLQPESTSTNTTMHDSFGNDYDDASYLILEEEDEEDEDEDITVPQTAAAALEGGYTSNGSKTKIRNHNTRLLESISLAGSKGKPFRLYFRCHKGCRNEKALWLQAFSRLNRLSSQVRRKKTSSLGSFLLSTTYSPIHKVVHAGQRRLSNSLARDVRQLELHGTKVNGDMSESGMQVLDHHYNYNPHNVEEMARGKKDSSSSLKPDKEYRVEPAYAYPHRWMTHAEMREEMVLPSDTYHNLRHSGCSKTEVGSLKVEVLQCLGLPKLDRLSLTDAIVYLVCGEYAFATDVIPNRANPMWLRKARRACIFPIFNAYARLYVGVFDDDRKRVKDEFAGRVVIDLARLRPRSTYDVTLPLRLSTHVYSKRRRGAIRLRFSVTWKSERDALMSYIPKTVRIPLPQNSKPNLDVAVLCADQKAFRNIAITVHGANLPGKFTFQQMRAALREINYTRKYIFTAIRTWVRDTRRWQIPTTSALIFLAWMHCIYANQFSLVPAYVVLFFVFQLMRTYAKYGIDAPSQQGFVPPSWEEMLAALIQSCDEEHHAIEPLEMGLRRKATTASTCNAESSFADYASHADYVVKTHEPKGKMLFRALGLMNDREGGRLSPRDDLLEFPYANPADYPRFTVKDSLVPRRGEGQAGKDAIVESLENDDPDSEFMVNGYDGESRIPRISDMVEMPEILRHMELPDIMRKDSSGLQEFDEEEDNFAPHLAVVHSGKVAASTITKTGRVAATAISGTATGLAEISGLHHVVSPIHKGISSGISNSVHFVQGPVTQVMGPVSSYSSSFFRNQSLESDTSSFVRSRSTTLESNGLSSSAVGCEKSAAGYGDVLSSSTAESDKGHNVDPLFTLPEQNVDVQGPSSGKKLTEDLAEVKEKVHEMTWNLFNDKIYHIKYHDTCYFGQAKKGKRPNKKDVAKDLDKLLKVNKYSHPNPFVARVGLYVEPIIGSAYSFLCVFRAGFNVVTWRDPMLTFWVSLICGLLSLILFIFPWRIFLFFLGVFLVGPQNWAIRILREKGHLPPLPPRRRTKMNDTEDADDSVLPIDKPVFTHLHRQPGKELPVDLPDDLDPREIHRVVIPYSPLIYQRFYDWPPEPQYAQVIPDAPDDSYRRKLNQSTLLSRKPPSFFASSLQSGDKDGSNTRSLRRRFHHSRTSSGNVPSPTSISSRQRSKSVSDASLMSSFTDKRKESL